MNRDDENKKEEINIIEIYENLIDKILNHNEEENKRMFEYCDKLLKRQKRYEYTLLFGRLLIIVLWLLTEILLK